MKLPPISYGASLTLLHSEWPKLHRVLAVLSAIELKEFTPLTSRVLL